MPDHPLKRKLRWHQQTLPKHRKQCQPHLILPHLHPQRPLSDSKLAGVLSEQGIKVARRTVAKYREAMAIPSSSERKSLI